MAQLLSAFGKKGVRLGLDTLQVDIEDTSFLSKYFVISEFNPVFSAGQIPVSFNGSALLKPTTEIKIECLDSNGNPLYIDSPKSNVAYENVSAYLVSIHIYNETYNGPGKLIFVGTTVKNEIVRWKTNITIDKTLQNTSKVIFHNKPTIESRGLLYPLVTNDSATILTSTIPFTGYFYSLPVSPASDINKATINPKAVDTDYRLILNDENVIIGPTLYPTTSFNTQMEGQPIVLYVEKIHTPFSDVNENVNATASFIVKKVMSDTVLQLSEPYYYDRGKNTYVTTIESGIAQMSYVWIAYDTRPEAYNPDFRNSYVELTYRNIRTFSGVVSRHKVYRKSVVYPGDFELIVDEPILPVELLVDPITNNKMYNLMGTFYNQEHIDKYWISSDTNVICVHEVSPNINSMKISSPSYSYMDGTKYVIVKADSAGIINDAYFMGDAYAYESSSFNNMSGVSYNSSFISLKANTLYALSMNIIIDKDTSTRDAKVSFYFYGSGFNDMTIETTYDENYGWKLGEILSDNTSVTKTFSGIQTIFFTPVADYYGTLIIVPYLCNATLSNVSLKVYGDYGFSPDTLSTKIAFPANIAGESFQIKSELYDINSTLVYSDLQTIQTIDVGGSSTSTRIGETSVTGLSAASAGGGHITLTSVYNSTTIVSNAISVDKVNRIWIDLAGTKSISVGL